MKFFIASAGHPEESYTDSNFERITTKNSFNLYEHTRQKGAISKVSKGDVLILKYKDELVCYGQVKKHRKTENEEFNLWIDVDFWVYHNNENKYEGVSNYGVQKATLGGGQQGTIKLVKNDYALKRIRQINDRHQLFDYISKTYMMNKNQLRILEIEKIIKYKKQIIFQGPPGTGKTKLAKELAKELTSKNKIISVKKRIEYFFENYKKPDKNSLKKRQEIEDELALFKQKYPQDKIKDLKLEEYTLGQEDRDGFCYWLEYKLIHTGKYNGQASKFKIYYNQEKGKYIKSNEFKEIDDEETMHKVADRIQSVVNDPFKNGVNVELGKGFVLKLLNTYKSKDFFPINSEKILDQFLNAVGKDIEGKNYLQKNQEIQTYFESQRRKHNIDTTNYEFMHYLFNYDVLNDDTDNTLDYSKDEDFKTVQFHPSYTYEDFVRGISVETNNNSVEYIVKNRVIAELANTAIINPENDYVLIIDEINRANLPSVFGELIYALEYREKKVESMYKLKDKGRELVLPENLYIIGTMNTADRSVGNIDYAIRRRFAFVEILPEDISGSLEDKYDFAIDEFNKVKSLFTKEKTDWESSDYLSNEFDPKDVCIGHSYFIYKKGEEENKRMKMEYEVKAILQEYLKDGVLKTVPENFIKEL